MPYNNLADMFKVYTSVEQTNSSNKKEIQQKYNWNDYLQKLIDNSFSISKNNSKKQVFNENTDLETIEFPNQGKFVVSQVKPTSTELKIIDLSSQTKRNLNAKKAYIYLTNKGMNPSIVSGIVGNLYYENLGNPDQETTDSKGTIAFGVAGFNSKGEFPNLVKYCNKTGKDKNKLESQLDFLYDYINSGVNRQLTSALSSKDIAPREASFIFGKYFEKFAGRDGTGEGYKNKEDPEHLQRGDAAEQIYNLYNKL